MSKKLFSTQRWKDYIKSRQRAQDQNAKRRRRRKGIRPRRRSVISHRSFRTITVPQTFSIVQNPEETISLLNKLWFYAEKHNLTLDLEGVNHLTTDAIAVLVATIYQVPTNVRGNLPVDTVAQEILVGSGFFSHVHSTQRLPSVRHGQIAQEKSKKVQPDLARDLIHFGTKALGAERKCSAAYRVLIECMSNTHNHAARVEKYPELWWATVFADQARKRVCFTFVDTGVGIFKSVKLGGLRRFYRLVAGSNDADILRDMLHGKVASRTGKPYRGKGLPAIYRLSEIGKIRELVVIANDVYARVPSGEFRVLKGALHGTLLYWEVEVN